MDAPNRIAWRTNPGGASLLIWTNGDLAVERYDITIGRLSGELLHETLRLSRSAGHGDEITIGAYDGSTGRLSWTATRIVERPPPPPPSPRLWSTSDLGPFARE